MIGLFLLAVFIVYAWLCFKAGHALVKRASSGTAKVSITVAVCLIAFAIPFGDEVVGRYRFEGYCQKESGYKFFKTASLPEGLLLNYVDDKVAEKWIKQRGLKYIEMQSGIKYIEGKAYPNIIHITSINDGRTQISSLDMPQAPFSLVTDYYLAAKSIRRDDLIIKKNDVQEVYARYAHPRYLGGWIARHMFPRPLSVECDMRSSYGDIEKTLIKAVFGIIN